MKKFGGSNKPIEGDTQLNQTLFQEKSGHLRPCPRGRNPKFQNVELRRQVTRCPNISNVIPEAPELPKPKAKQEGPLSFSDQIKAKSQEGCTQIRSERMIWQTWNKTGSKKLARESVNSIRKIRQTKPKSKMAEV